MAIAFVNAVASRTTATLSHVVTMPTFSAGDVVVVEIAWNGGPGAITPPAGWSTLVALISGATNPQQSVYYRVMQAGDSASYTWTTGNSVISGHSACGYSGVDNTIPIDVAASSAFSATAGTTATATGVTTVTDNAWPIGGAAANSSTQSFTSNWGLERTDVQAGQVSGSGKAETQTDNNAGFTPAGATGNKTWTISSSLAWTAWLSALRPAAGGGGGAVQQGLMLLGVGS